MRPQALQPKGNAAPLATVAAVLSSKVVGCDLGSLHFSWEPSIHQVLGAGKCLGPDK